MANHRINQLKRSKPKMMKKRVIKRKINQISVLHGLNKTKTQNLKEDRVETQTTRMKNKKKRLNKKKRIVIIAGLTMRKINRSLPKRNNREGINKKKVKIQ